MRYPTPLRYPGGKGKLANYIKLIFEQNKLLDGHYVEPYAGGAGVALELLYQEYAATIHINDLNPSVHSFWFSVLNETENLCRMIKDTPITMDEWSRQKEIQKNPSVSNSLELGFSTFFLNRTNRSGIINAGAIGGNDQTGNWLIDARYNKEGLIKRIVKIARYKARIKLYNLDAIDLIANILPSLPEKTLVYLDPPYYVKGKDLYQNHYSHNDHVELSNSVKNNIAQKWVVSYDFVPQICDMYSEFRQINYSISYSAAKRQTGTELMVFDDSIVIPDVASPVWLKVA